MNMTLNPIDNIYQDVLAGDCIHLDLLAVRLISYKSNIKGFVGFGMLNREYGRLLPIVYYGGMLLKLFL
jgi:hypothetical protein